MIKRVTRIFDRCINCPFCVDKHIKEITGYYIKYMCRKLDYKEISKEDLTKFPEECPLNYETIIDLTVSFHNIIDMENEYETGDD